MKKILLILSTALTTTTFHALAEPSGTKAGNGNEYQAYKCVECDLSEATPNPKMSAEKEKDAEEMQAKLALAREKKQLDEADKIAHDGIQKGYMLFYAEMSINAQDRENISSGTEIPFRDSKKREWLTKGAEHGSNGSVESLFRFFQVDSSQKDSPRSDLIEAWFWGYIGLTSGILLDDDPDWISANKRINPKEKATTLTRAKEWMKQHNWPAITR